MSGSDDTTNKEARELEGQLTLFAGQVVGTQESGTQESGTPDSGTPESGTPESGTLESEIHKSDSAIIQVTESEAVSAAVPSDIADDTKSTKARGGQRSKKGAKEMQTQEAPSDIDFEASLTQLETVVRELDGEIKLEAALKLFETGIKLSVDCEKFIKSAEQKIEILKKQADGSYEAQSFESETKRILAGD